MTSDYSHTFFRRFNAMANLYTIVGGKKDQRIKNGRVCFTTEKKAFDFFVVVQSSDPKNTKDKYMFPIGRLEMNMFVQMEPATNKVVYEWQAEGGLSIQLEFEVVNQDFDDAIRFRNNIVRLIYQAAYKRPFTDCPNIDDIEKFCPMKDSTVVQTPKAVMDAFQVIIKDNTVEFASIGELTSLDPSQADSKPMVISPHFIFVLRTVGDFQYQVQIYDDKAQCIYKLTVDQNLQFHINSETNSMAWMDMKAGQAVHLSFKFRENDAGKNLNVVITMSIMQSMKQKKFDDVVKDSDWMQYYGNTQEQVEEEPTDEGRYQEYIDTHRMDTEFVDTNTFVEPTHFKNLNHTDLAQGKVIDRTFVSQDNNISVYQALEDDSFNFICNLPPVKTFEGDAMNPRKMMLTDKDTKVLMLNKDEKDGVVYFMDLEKGKIISELSGQAGTGVKDISNYEKNSDMAGNPLFFGCNEKNIFEMDPRVKNAVVAERPYATNYMFNSISGAKDGTFVVGSKDGALRMYSQCSGNAKNVLPSLLGEAILHIDVSKDGAFILATCRSHVMLIPTFQEGKSGFSHMFRKTNKPHPIILKVNPRSLAKLGVNSIDYTYAIFDNKSDRETLIAANAGPYLILWDLSKVLSGKHDTTTIKSLGDKIVHNEFRYNSDKLIAALPHKLVCQSAKVAKR
jgi:hypothetical protein